MVYKFIDNIINDIEYGIYNGENFYKNNDYHIDVAYKTCFLNDVKSKNLQKILFMGKYNLDYFIEGYIYNRNELLEEITDDFFGQNIQLVIETFDNIIEYKKSILIIDNASKILSGEIDTLTLQKLLEGILKKYSLNINFKYYDVLEQFMFMNITQFQELFKELNYPLSNDLETDILSLIVKEYNLEDEIKINTNKIKDLHNFFGENIDKSFDVFDRIDETLRLATNDNENCYAIETVLNFSNNIDYIYDRILFYSKNKQEKKDPFCKSIVKNIINSIEIIYDEGEFKYILFFQNELKLYSFKDDEVLDLNQIKERFTDSEFNNTFNKVKKIDFYNKEHNIYFYKIDEYKNIKNYKNILIKDKVINTDNIGNNYIALKIVNGYVEEIILKDEKGNRLLLNDSITKTNKDVYKHKVISFNEDMKFNFYGLYNKEVINIKNKPLNLNITNSTKFAGNIISSIETRKEIVNTQLKLKEEEEKSFILNLLVESINDMSDEEYINNLLSKNEFSFDKIKCEELPEYFYDFIEYEYGDLNNRINLKLKYKLKEKRFLEYKKQLIENRLKPLYKPTNCLYNNIIRETFKDKETTNIENTVNTLETLLDIKILKDGDDITNDLNYINSKINNINNEINLLVKEIMSVNNFSLSSILKAIDENIENKMILQDTITELSSNTFLVTKNSKELFNKPVKKNDINVCTLLAKNNNIIDNLLEILKNNPDLFLLLIEKLNIDFDINLDIDKIIEELLNKLDLDKLINKLIDLLGINKIISFLTDLSNKIKSFMCSILLGLDFLNGLIDKFKTLLELAEILLTIDFTLLNKSPNIDILSIINKYVDMIINDIKNILNEYIDDILDLLKNDLLSNIIVFFSLIFKDLDIKPEYYYSILNTILDKLKSCGTEDLAKIVFNGILDEVDEVGNEIKRMLLIPLEDCNTTNKGNNFDINFILPKVNLMKENKNANC